MSPFGNHMCRYRMSLPCVLVCVILLASGIAVQTTPQACPVQHTSTSHHETDCLLERSPELQSEREGTRNEVDRHGFVGMLQLDLNVQREPQLPLWPPFSSRTYVSTDPMASAEFFYKYFAATPIPARECSSYVTSVQVPLSNGGHTVYSFVEGAALPTDLDIDGLIATKESSIGAVFTEGASSSMWIDNHEGINTARFNWAKASQDGVQMGIFGPPVALGIGRGQVIRLNIPHTLWTLEVASITDAMAANLSQYASEDGGCRVPVGPGGEDLPDDFFTGPWFKSTHMSYDPFKSADWMMKVMGARAETSALQGGEGCALAAWVLQKGHHNQTFRIHFVRAPDSEGDRERSLFEDIEAVCNRDVHELDALMFNSLVTTVQSLDPYIQRLRYHSFRFVLISAGESEHVLLARIPGTMSAVQLRSEHVTVAEPIRLSLNQCLLKY